MQVVPVNKVVNKNNWGKGVCEGSEELFSTCHLMSFQEQTVFEVIFRIRNAVPNKENSEVGFTCFHVTGGIESSLPVDPP
jgi:hypothetical protein